MIKDPLTVWDGHYPYDAMAKAGITPRSSKTEIDDASYTLMIEGMMGDPTTREAWDELRALKRRLLADFVLYDVDPADIVEAREQVQRELANPSEPPEVAAALTIPAELLDELADELREITLEPPPPVDVSAEFDGVPSTSLISSLIRFDR